MADRSQLEVKLPVRGMLVGFIVIFALLVLATAATHFIPAGTYRRQSRIDERTGSTLEVVIPDSFRYTDANPQGLLAFLYSPVKSLYYQGPVGGGCSNSFDVNFSFFRIEGFKFSRENVNCPQKQARAIWLY